MSEDQETARLLAELEGEKTEREQLEARADELGVKYRGNTSDDTLRERVEAASAEITQPVTPEIEAAIEVIVKLGDVLTNPGKSVRRMGIITMAPASKHPLTDRERADSRTMAKVNHMVKLGVIHRGAD